MFAVIKTGGKQYRVKEGDVLSVEKIDAEQGKEVVFDEVLLVESGEGVLIGTPFVDRAQVKAMVVESFKDKKVIVFKKKRRKQYKRKRGHRQELTRVKIEEILTGVEPAPKAKPPERPAAPKKTEAPKEPIPGAETAEKKQKAEPVKVDEKTTVEKVVKKTTPAKTGEEKKAARTGIKTPAKKKPEAEAKPKAKKTKVTKE